MPDAQEFGPSLGECSLPPQPALLPGPLAVLGATIPSRALTLVPIPIPAWHSVCSNFHHLCLQTPAGSSHQLTSPTSWATTLAHLDHSKSSSCLPVPAFATQSCFLQYKVTFENIRWKPQQLDSLFPNPTTPKPAVHLFLQWKHKCLP